MISISSNKSINKFQHKKNQNDSNSFCHLSIPFHIFNEKRVKKLIYNGNEKMYFENRNIAFKKILRGEALKYINKL